MPLNLRLSPQLKGYELRICRSLSSGSLKGLSFHSTIVKLTGQVIVGKKQRLFTLDLKTNGVLRVFVEKFHDLM